MSLYFFLFCEAAMGPASVNGVNQVNQVYPVYMMIENWSGRFTWFTDAGPIAALQKRKNVSDQRTLFKMEAMTQGELRDIS